MQRSATAWEDPTEEVVTLFYIGVDSGQRNLLPPCRIYAHRPKIRLRSGTTEVSLWVRGGGALLVIDGAARHQKLNSPVLLSAGGAIVGGCRQSVAEAF